MLPPTPSGNNERSKPSQEIAHSSETELPMYHGSRRSSNWNIDAKTGTNFNLGAGSAATLAHEFDTHSDLVSTSASDVWSMSQNGQNDSHSLSVNLTSIIEDSDDKELFLSPQDYFLDSIPRPNRVSPGSNDFTSTPTRRKSDCSARSSLSHTNPPAETPCRKLASKIETLDSPARSRASSAYTDILSSQKVWTTSLDEELLRCWNKYKVYKISHNDPAIFRYTSRNKILSRMLLSRTSVFRTAKQVSCRLQRLLKNRDADSSNTPFTMDEAPPPQPVFQKENNVPVMPVSQTFSTPSVGLNIFEFCMAFHYRDFVLGSHSFASLGPTPVQPPSCEDFAEIAKTIHHKKFLMQLTSIAPTMVSQNVPIHNVLCAINFTHQPNSSSPMSPHASSRLINLGNGDFLSYLKIKVPKTKSNQSFLSWRSIITVYKGLEEILLSTEDAVNGYRDQNQDFMLQVPFINSFWSGYLSFLMNGSNSYNDLNDLTILQVICDGEMGLGKIHGCFIYNFATNDRALPSLTVSMFTLRNAPADSRLGLSQQVPEQFNGIKTNNVADTVQSKTPADDVDELETILAPSSPVCPTPGKPDDFKPEMRVNVDMANIYSMQGPSTAPLFDSRAIRNANANLMTHKSPPTQIYFHPSKSSSNIMTQSLDTGVETQRPYMARHFSCDFLPQQAKIENFVAGNQPVPQTVNVNQSSTLFEDKQFNMFMNGHDISSIETGCPPQGALDTALNIDDIDSKPWNLGINTDSLAFESPIVQSAPASREHFFPALDRSSEVTNDAGQVLKQAHIHQRAAELANRRASHSMQSSSSGQVLKKGPVAQTHASQTSLVRPPFHKFPTSQPVMYQPKKK